MTPMNRRNALKIGAALPLITAPFVMPGRARAATTISVVSWGGTYGEQLRQFWLEPFTAETGIAVQSVTGPELAKMKAQVESNNILWDVIDGFAYPGAKEDLLEPVDFKIVNPDRFAMNVPPFAIPVSVYTGGIAYDPTRTPAPAKDFAQFWDVNNFPARRGLPNGAGMLAVALLADGVAPDKLYPLDVERGFRSLDRIKPHVKKWFAATAEGTSLIQTKEVDYTYTYANRVFDAKKAGVPIEFSRDQCISTVQYFCVLKGTPRKEAAMRFLEFITRPEQTANWVNKLGGMWGPPVIKGVEGLLSPSVRNYGPDPSSTKHVIYNEEFWADRFVELDKRFKEWILT